MGSDWQSDANTNNNTNVTSILPPSLVPSITGKIAVVSKLTGGKNDKHSHSSINLNTPDSCIIVGGPGIGTGLELNGQLRDIIDNLTPLNFGMGREARGRSRRQPTLFNPQTCAASDWQSDANTNNNTNVTWVLPPSLVPSITGKIAVVSKLTGGKNDKHSHSSNNLNDKNMSSTSNLDSITTGATSTKLKTNAKRCSTTQSPPQQQQQEQQPSTSSYKKRKMHHLPLNHNQQ